jgi:uncharacterized protein
MQTQIELELSPEAAANEADIRKAAAKLAGLDEQAITAIQTVKRSIDARKREIKIRLRLELYIGEHPTPPAGPKLDYRDVRNAKRAIIVGAGPAGLFAALRMIELGLRPIILERGKDVRERRRDLARINREMIVNPDSNYCFGEGGAGTYSDGKLYTRCCTPARTNGEIFAGCSRSLLPMVLRAISSSRPTLTSAQINYRRSSNIFVRRS